MLAIAAFNECRALLVRSKKCLLELWFTRTESSDLDLILNTSKCLVRLEGIVERLEQNEELLRSRELSTALEGVKEKIELRSEAFRHIIDNLYTTAVQDSESALWVYALACEVLDRDELYPDVPTCSVDPLKLERLILAKPFAPWA